MKMREKNINKRFYSKSDSLFFSARATVIWTVALENIIPRAHWAHFSQYFDILSYNFIVYPIQQEMENFLRLKAIVID